MNLSVITLTLNEEANIGACLDSVMWADEMIVVDSGSTDRTLELATSRGARILSIEWKGYGRQRIVHLKGQWQLDLWLDAEERVPRSWQKKRVPIAQGMVGRRIFRCSQSLFSRSVIAL